MSPRCSKAGHHANNHVLLTHACIHDFPFFKIYIERRNITDARAALMKALEELNAGLLQAKSDNNEAGGVVLLSGNPTVPHLGDVSVYGVLRGLQGLEVFDTVLNAYPSIQEWYQAMQQIVEP